MRSNPVLDKSFEFAVRIVKCCDYLRKAHVDPSLCRQLLRSGTSIGANVAEAQGGVSKKEFSQKIGIAYKEALETQYWLRLLHATGYLAQEPYDSIYTDASELGKLLNSILKSSGRQER
jgi:four helix bundle protein